MKHIILNLFNRSNARCHCRGVIFGDKILSELLKFNGTVTKEYYINDYGNQINNFVESFVEFKKSNTKYFQKKILIQVYI